MTATTTLQVGDFVRIVSGAFTGMTGDVVDVNDAAGLVVVRMTSTGRPLAFWPHEVKRETRGQRR